MILVPSAKQLGALLLKSIGTTCAVERLIQSPRKYRLSQRLIGVGFVRPIVWIGSDTYVRFARDDASVALDGFGHGKPSWFNRRRLTDFRRVHVIDDNRDVGLNLTAVVRRLIGSRGRVVASGMGLLCKPEGGERML